MNAKALGLIKEFEGLRLASYDDGIGVATIGYGTTRWPDGSPVKLGQNCTQKQAEQMLEAYIQKNIIPNLQKVPDWDKMTEEQQAALISFAYNLGAGFYKSDNFETISRYLASKDWEKVPEAFMLYVMPGSPVEAGLRRRRKAEGDLWQSSQNVTEAMPAEITPEKFQDFWRYYRNTESQVSGVWTLYSTIKSKAPELLQDDAAWIEKYREAPDFPNPLHVTYCSQRDNYRDANRTCFSSSCAMLVMALKPGAIHSDDDYIKTVFSIGDTTDANVQVKALAHYGIKARFTQQASKKDIIEQIDKGIPVPCGYLHHGTPLHPTGGGHWCCVIGYDDDGVFVNDPWGECSLMYGTFPSYNGANAHYSDKNWTNSRWCIEGPNTGYAIIAERE